MEGPRAGRMIIGQVARHEINLEIEGVQDKKNKLISFHFKIVLSLLFPKKSKKPF